MATIKSDGKRITNYAAEFGGIAAELSKIAKKLAGAEEKLDRNVRSRNRIGDRLKEMRDSFEADAKVLRKAAEFVTESSAAFTQAEMKNVTETLGDAASGKQGTGSAGAAAAMTGTLGAYSMYSGSLDKTGAAYAAAGTEKPATALSVFSRSWKPGDAPGADAKTPVAPAAKKADDAAKKTGWKPAVPNKDAKNTGAPQIGSQRAAAPSTPPSLADKAKGLAYQHKDKLMVAGLSGAGMALGKGVSFAAGHAGLEGRTAAAGAETSVTGIQKSSVNMNGDMTTYAQANLGEAAARAGAQAVFDPAGGNVGVSASAFASATGARASAGFENGYSHAKAEAAAGFVGAGAAADMSLMKDGSLKPSVNASVQAEVSALKAAAGAGLHHDGYSLKADAKGSVGTASAAANLSLDPAGGNMSADVNAMAAAAKGQASVSADVGLATVGVKGTGYAGAAGVHAGVGFKDGTLSANVGAALGVGGGVEMSVGLGNWAKKLDEKTSGAVGDAFSALGSGVQTVLAPVGAIVGAGKSIVESAKGVGESIARGDAVSVFKNIGEGAAGVGKAVANGVKTAAEGVGKAAVGAGKAVVKVASAVGTGIAKAVKSVGNWFKSW